MPSLIGSDAAISNKSKPPLTTNPLNPFPQQGTAIALGN